MYDTKTFRNVGRKTLQAPLETAGLLNRQIMISNGIYFGKESFYRLIRSIGGQWNDSKERPIVCMLQSKTFNGLYWAIPIGNWDHRSEEAKSRIIRYMNYPVDDLRSCYYHVGNTDVRSIFFISDVVPITDSFIEREYISRYSHQIYVIKNKRLLSEIERKVSRILSFEHVRPNYFRQHITDIVSALTKENDGLRNQGNHISK